MVATVRVIYKRRSRKEGTLRVRATNPIDAVRRAIDHHLNTPKRRKIRHYLCDTAQFVTVSAR